MEALKKYLVEACEYKLDYYDLVDEGSETIDYGGIIDFVFDRIAEMLIGRADNG